MYKRSANFVTLVLLSAIPIGCGLTTSTGFGSNSIGGKNTVTRLDFYVDNNTLSSLPEGQQNVNGTKGLQAFILASLNSSNQNATWYLFDPGLEDKYFPKNVNGVRVASTSNTLPPNPGQASLSPAAPSPASGFYYITSNFPNSAVPTTSPNNTLVAGVIDPVNYVYTPPPVISANPTSSPVNNTLDTIILAIKPQDPTLPPVSIEIHLNLGVTISPNPASIQINTAQQPSLNTLQLTAHVPGDAIDTPSTGGPVTWSAFTDLAATNPFPNVVNAATGLFTAPSPAGIPTGIDASKPFTIYVQAVSILQPDKKAITPVNVNVTTGTVTFN